MKLKNLLTVLFSALLLSGGIFADEYENTDQQVYTEEVIEEEKELPALHKELTITKSDDAMFWIIDSIDDEGEPSRLYVLGTIHLADDEIYPVPDYILDAWDDSDWICGEISTDGWQNYMRDIGARVGASLLNEDEPKTDELLSDEEKAIIIESIGESSFKQLSKFEPWILNSALGGAVFKKCPLEATKSYDVYFIKKATEAGIFMYGLDELEDQLDFISYGNQEIQLKMLKTTLSNIKNSDDSVKDIVTLYDAYKTADIETFNKAYADQLKREIAVDPLYKDYYTEMLTKRNARWAEEFKEMLDYGGTNFIFAGCAHFAGEDSVFEFLKALYK